MFMECSGKAKQWSLLRLTVGFFTQNRAIGLTEQNSTYFSIDKCLECLFYVNSLKKYQKGLDWKEICLKKFTKNSVTAGDRTAVSQT